MLDGVVEEGVGVAAVSAVIGVGIVELKGRERGGKVVKIREIGGKMREIGAEMTQK